MIIKKSILTGFIVFVLGSACPAQSGLSERINFASAKPHTWWFLDDMHERTAKLDADENAIKRDLEAMAKQGLGGFYVYSYGGMANPDRAWRDKIRFAFGEAARLGLEGGLVLGSGGCCASTAIDPDLAQQELVFTQKSVTGGQKVSVKLSRGKSQYSKILKPDGSPAYFHDIAVFAVAGENFDAKGKPTDVPVPHEKIFLLNDFFDVNSDILTWQAPPGEWQVVRIAHTPRLNGYTGYFIDHLSRKAMKSHWDMLVGTILNEMTAEERKGFRSVLCDSWEAGTLNWTFAFADEFRKRRGYEITPWLPVLAGVIIENKSAATRFKRDYTLTLSDLLNENHYRYTMELARANNMIAISEAAGPHQRQSDMIAATYESDISMGEFWLPSRHRPSAPQRFMVRDAATAAHVYGMKTVFAEAYTTIGTYWIEAPFGMKSTTDRAFCDGLNQICYHGSMLSPSLTEKPGRTRKAGMHYNPQITWWEHSGAFNDYLTRCSERLQSGRFVADALLYHGDGFGMFAGLKTPEDGLGRGYDYDLVNTELLLKSRLDNGEIVLPSGMRYKVLILSRKNPRDAHMQPGKPRRSGTPLPCVDHPISLEALRKVESLLKEGATVVGSRPVGPAGLGDDPREFESLASAIWPDDVAPVVRIGAGTLITRKENQLIRDTVKFAPDFSFESSGCDEDIDWIHRKVGEEDLYFVANLSEVSQEITAHFRAGSGVAVGYDAVTDQSYLIHPEKKGEYNLALPPCGSLFVTFGGKNLPESLLKAQAKKKSHEYDYPGVILSHAWQVSFDPDWGGPENISFDSLADWSTLDDPSIRYYSGTAVYRTHFDVKGPGMPEVLDLGAVFETAEVFLNGQRLGVAWMRPARLPLSGACKSGRNELEVRVANLWPNRLIRDAGLPEEKRLTKTNISPYKPDDTLYPSGLIGPVRLLNHSDPGTTEWDTDLPILVVKSARYEARDGSEGADVTDFVRRNVKGYRLTLPVNNTSIGFDPARGKYKHLKVVYSFRGHAGEKCVPTGETFVLP